MNYAKQIIKHCVCQSIGEKNGKNVFIHLSGCYLTKMILALQYLESVDIHNH